MRPLRLLLLPGLIGLLQAFSLAQQRPLITEIPEPLADGKARLEFGVDFLQAQQFPLSGLRGDLTHIGVIGGRIGLGSRVEFEVLGNLGNFLSIKGRNPAPFSNRLRLSGDSSKDTGDFLFATKIQIRREGERLPAFSFRAGAILPNLNNDAGIGINRIRTFASALAGKHLGKTHIFSNLGIIIIDNPAELATQSDKLLYGLAFVHPLSRHISLLGEIEGMHGNSHPGTEDVSYVRLGAQVSAGGLVWDVAALAGLKKSDAESGVVFGITRDFQIFGTSGPKRSPFQIDPLFPAPKRTSP